jgi:thioredoxin 1
MPIFKITEENFAEIEERSGVVLLDFGAEYCAPCRALASIMSDVANERADVAIGTVDVEAAPSVAAKFGVMSLPTLVALRSGKESGRLVGKISKGDVLRLIGK